MAHLLREYAKSLGVKTSKPIIKDHFFPILADKYITIFNDDNIPSKHYPYYSVVLDLIKPLLRDRGIQIIQLGGKSQIGGVDLALNVKYKQQSFILSKSILHLGSDGFLNHTASVKNIPTVNVFGNTLPDINKPIFSGSSLNINLSPKWDKKPCYNNIDPKKQINTIKPEVIAQSVLDLLKIDEEINFNTVQIGDAFNQKILEIVPTSIMDMRAAQDSLIIIRADYGFDENVFLQYCKTNKVSVCCDKLIQPQGMQQIANNVKDFYLFIDKDWDDIPENYFRIIKSLNINLIILCENKEDVPIIRNKYFDVVVRHAYPERNKPKTLGENSKFFSQKRVVCDGKEYLSYAHFKKGLDRSNTVIDTPEYWRESDHFYIYDTDKNSQEKSS